MSPVRTRRWNGSSLVGGSGEQPGNEGSDDFLSGLDSGGFIRATQPTIPSWDNTGHTGTLTPYTGTGAGGTLTINTAGTTFTNVDFGSTRIVVQATGVKFINCRWYVTDAVTDGYSTAQIDCRSGSNSAAGGGLLLDRCTIENVAQNVRGRTGVLGWNVTIKRSRVRGFVDNLGFYVPGSPGTGGSPLGVTVLDTFIGELMWNQHPEAGVVHQSDTKTHCDGIQFQGGYGARLINVTVIARYSTVVGTGTPGSGSDSGWAGSPYTQSEAEALRYATVFQGGTLANPAVRGYALGGSIAGIMVNTSDTRGRVVDMTIAWAYGAGGAYWLNNGDAITGSFGTIDHLRVLPDQRGANQNGSSAAWQVGIRSGVTVTMTDAFEAADTTTWASTGVAIIRRNA